MSWFNDIKDKVSSKISEITEDLWGPKTNLGQMMEASNAVSTSFEKLGLKLSKRELGFGLYHEAYQRFKQREADPAIDAREHADCAAVPLCCIEMLLWYG